MQSHNPTQSRELQWSHQIRLLLPDRKPVIPKANPQKESQCYQTSTVNGDSHGYQILPGATKTPTINDHHQANC